MIPVLGYWKIRGVAQPIRLLLAYTRTEYKDKRYEVGPAPTYDKTDWLSVKFTLGLDFPNLPYYIDDDVKLTQSTAILRYIARKHNLIGTNDKEETRVDIATGQLEDFREGFSNLCYHPDPDYDTAKPEYIKEMPGKLKQFSDFLGNNPYFASKNLSYADFMVYDMLDQHKLFSQRCLDQFPNLQQFTQRIEALPDIAAYMRSGTFLKTSLNGRMAKFGGDDN
jgi:glutathione S-transferase